MKDGMRFVDCDMHIIEPPDLFTKWLDPRFRERVITPIGADGKPKRGAWIIDGLASTGDQDLQQYRKPLRSPKKDGNQGGAIIRQPLSNSRIAASGRLGFAIERDYSAVGSFIRPNLAVHLHGLSPLRLQLPGGLQQPAQGLLTGDGGTDPRGRRGALELYRGGLPQGRRSHGAVQGEPPACRRARRRRPPLTMERPRLPESTERNISRGTPRPS